MRSWRRGRIVVNLTRGNIITTLSSLVSQGIRIHKTKSSRHRAFGHQGEDRYRLAPLATKAKLSVLPPPSSLNLLSERTKDLAHSRLLMEDRMGRYKDYR